MTHKNDSFIQKIKDQLKEFEEEIDLWEKKSQKYDDLIKQEFKKQSDEFRSLIDEGQLSLDKLKEKGEKDLHRVKDTLSFTVKTLQKSIDVFLDHWKKRGD